MSAIRLAFHPEGDRTLKQNPDVRLAYNPGPVNAYKALSEAPTVRLATTIAGGSMSPENVEKALNSPAVRLAHTHGAQGTGTLTDASHAARPALLVSFVYLEPFLKNQSRYCYRDWVLDSGAFSAHTSGKEIKLADYIATCKRLMESDPTLSEIFALDVIGDALQSRRNCEAMWEAGVPAIPCFHRGTPWAELVSLAKDYPKIALGGVATLRGHEKINFAKECFARVWPKRIHGFGFGAEKQVLALPWHSVDATNWEIGPCAFGRWNSMGGKFSVRGSNQNLRGEVEWYLELERKAQHKWRKTFAQLGWSDGDGGFANEIAIRLAAAGQSFVDQFLERARDPF